MDIFLNFLLNENQILFSSVLFLLLFLLIVEVVFFIIGFHSSSIFEQDFIVDNLNWLNKGQVPIFILIITFLGVFSLTGILFQYLTYSIINQYIVGGVLFFISMIIVRYLSIYIAKIIPQDETSIVSEDSYIGQIATVVIGVGNKDKDVEFKLVDKYNKTHYFMGYVIDGELKQGEKALVINKKDNGKFNLSVKII